jgi:hypothetical protein
VTGKHPRRSVWAARLLPVAAILVGVALFAVFGPARDVEADVGRSVETDLGIVTVHGWTTEGNETLVSIVGCPNASGATIDLSALRIGAGDAEAEASGSRLGLAEGGSPGCVRGSVRFPSIGPTGRVVYLASPRVVWRDPDLGTSPSAS